MAKVAQLTGVAREREVQVLNGDDEDELARQENIARLKGLAAGLDCSFMLTAGKRTSAPDSPHESGEYVPASSRGAVTATQRQTRSMAQATAQNASDVGNEFVQVSR